MLAKLTLREAYLAGWRAARRSPLPDIDQAEHAANDWVNRTVQRARVDAVQDVIDPKTRDEGLINLSLIEGIVSVPNIERVGNTSK